MGNFQMKKKTEETIKQWLKAPFDEEMREEVKKLIKDHQEEAQEAFGSLISFGTGGMREKMGPGPNRINKYTISLASHAVALHMLKSPKQMWKKGVVVCHDCRIHSRDFAIETARVFAGNGIAVYLTKDLRPTPFCSFAIRYLGAIGGVNITASHNPKEYNGFKVYWHDGGQVVYPHDKAIAEELFNIKDIGSIPMSEENSPLIKIIDESVEKAYLEAVYDESIFKHTNETLGKNLHICYSPLHGAGITMIPDALALWGFENLTLVSSQSSVDGNFPTTKTPNPETEEGRSEGIKTLIKTGADLLLISDPDSDRLSVSEQKNGTITTFTGNELGIIFLYFLAKEKKLEENWASITTIVSTPLCKIITEDLGGRCFEVLTGFKYISELIEKWEREEKGRMDFILGFEESLGYLSSKNIRDKDATLAACQICEIALHLKQKGKSLKDYLYSIYEKYGIYREGGISIAFEEKHYADGAFIKFMENIPKSFFHQEVIKIDNYKTSTSTNFKTNQTTKIDLPVSNVLTFHLKNGDRYIIRPSGTEPKIKIYASLGEKRNPNFLIEDQLKNLDAKIKANLSFFFGIFNP